MPVQLDERAAPCWDKIQALGVEVLVEKATEVHRGSRPVIACVSGRHHIETDVLLFSAGIRPPTPWPGNPGWRSGSAAASASTTAAQFGSRHPSPSASARSGRAHLRPGGPGYQMARAAVASLCGGETRFIGADMSTKLKLMGWTWAPSAMPTPPPPGRPGAAAAGQGQRHLQEAGDRRRGTTACSAPSWWGTGRLRAAAAVLPEQGGAAPAAALPAGGEGAAPAPLVLPDSAIPAPATTSAKGTWWPPFGRAITSCRR